MPRYRVNMVAPGPKGSGGARRVTVLQARDKDDAQSICERRELQIAAHEYPADVLADLEAQEQEADDAGVRVPAQVRMQLATHRQAKPYDVVSVEEVK